jgi:competence protein ComEA
LLAALAFGIIFFSILSWWRKTDPAEISYTNVRNEVVEASQKTKTELVVYVSGQVKQPGVLKISAGSRVIDAINAAGGLVEGADVVKINLAQAVKDGMQIHVPGHLAAPQDNGNIPRQNATARQNDKININTADAVELDKLPGVGPSLAARIVEWRKNKGSFTDGTELKKVPGIGESKYQQIKDKIAW